MCDAHEKAGDHSDFKEEVIEKGHITEEIHAACKVPLFEKLCFLRKSIVVVFC